MNVTVTALSAAALAAGLAAPSGAFASEYARVLSATPVVGQVGAPQRECVDSQRVVERQPSGAGAVIGAIVGGVVGNQFGHGGGRLAATGLGAVAGAAVGNQAENNRGYATVRDCRTVGAVESRVIGYDVVYEYNGQRYTTRTATDPGPRLAVDVRPAAPPLDRVGPPATYQPVPPVTSAPVPAYSTYSEGSAPTYVESYPAYAQPAPVYYRPAPVYYGSPYYYPYPAVSIGIGGGYWGGGWHRGGYNGHWRR